MTEIEGALAHVRAKATPQTRLQVARMVREWRYRPEVVIEILCHLTAELWSRAEAKDD